MNETTPQNGHDERIISRNTTAFDLLRLVGARDDALEWVGHRTLQEAWEQCERGDWLLWLAARAGVDRRLVVAAACACARLALVHVPAEEERPRVALETAEAWCRGEVTTEQVRDAKDDAEAAAAPYAHADAYAAPYAPYAACAAVAAACAYAVKDTTYIASPYAAYVAADAAVYAAEATADAGARAGEATLRQCADLVRQLIPLDAVLAGLQATKST